MGFINIILNRQMGFDYDAGWLLISSVYIVSAFGLKYALTPSKVNKDLFLSILKILVIFLVITSALDYLFPISFLKKLEIRNTKILFPLFHWNISLTKSADIIFQQVLINMLVEFYLTKYDRKKSIKYFGIFFAVLHLPLFYLFGLHGLYFIIPSIAGGLIFAYLITNFEKGRLLSLSCHFSFYLVLGIFLRYFS